MSRSEKILDEVATIIGRVTGHIMADLHVRHSVTLRRSLYYKAQLLVAVQLLEKLEQLPRPGTKD
jgi:hypothetical protein